MMTPPNFELTPQSNPLTILKQALASYEETINLSNGLSLEDPDNRHRLADTYLQRGEVFQTLGNVEPDAFSKALACYDQAIRLARDLPIDSSEYRKLLAETYKKRGEVLRLVGTQALETEDELEARRKRYQTLRLWLQERIATGDAEYDERVGGLLEAELERA
jgi:tetratricopeptide (TPR) repeat protein